jgi:hypothetical protein
MSQFQDRSASSAYDGDTFTDDGPSARKEERIENP